MKTIDAILDIILVALTPLAGPYRVVMHNFRTFGGVGTGLLTWGGVILLYPWFAVPSFWTDDPRIFYLSWAALGVLTYIQTFAKWCSESPRVCEGASRFGRWEPVFALALCFGMSEAVGPGAAKFVLMGYACSIAQFGIVRLRAKLAAWTPEDAQKLERVLDTVRETAKRWAPIAMLWAGRACKASRIAVVTIVPLLFVPFKALGFLRRPTADAAPAAPVKGSPTFASRVMVHICGSLILGWVTGGFSIVAVFKCFSFILAAILMLGGWHMKPPDGIRNEASEFVVKAKDVLEEKHHELETKVEQKKHDFARKRRRFPF
jgi:uncharacterized membrane protein